ELVQQEQGVHLVAGSMLLIDLLDELGLELPARDEDTVGGLVLSELGRRPRIGDRVELSSLRFDVVEVQGNRIRTVRLTLPRPARE
ncbi:MAG TPA: transporter associated domain-containing protein, partial [Acidimicrobiia bacterium]